VSAHERLEFGGQDETDPLGTEDSKVAAAEVAARTTVVAVPVVVVVVVVVENCRTVDLRRTSLTVRWCSTTLT
jgi:hypothetical protein